MTIKNNICNKISSRVGKNNLIVLFLILLLILISSAVFAIPDSLTLQGKLTNLGGTAQTGTFNFTFKIYDAYTGGNVLWKDDDRDITTDANGIYDVILYNLSALNFSEQYYLGITVSTDNESKPRINLTSSPYSFRANISEDLNKENAYTVSVFNITGNLTIGESFADVLTVTTGRLNISDGSIVSAGNLTLGEKISFSLGSIIDNLVSGFLRISSGLNVTGNVSIAQDTLFVDNTSNRVGIGTTNPNYKLDVVGSINATNINATGIIQATTFIGSGSSLTGISSTTSVWNSSGTNIYLNDTTASVGIGDTTPSDALEVIGNVRVSGSLNASFINATEIRQGTNLVQTINAVFNLGNLTSYFGDSGFNGSVLRVSNMSNIRESEFTLTNLTRYFGDSGFNGSVLRVGNLSTIFLDRNTSLWNASGSDTILGEQGGNVGIGTVTPKQKLEVSGNILVNNTANAFVNLSGPTIRKSGSDIVISD